MKKLFLLCLVLLLVGCDDTVGTLMGTSWVGTIEGEKIDVQFYPQWRVLAYHDDASFGDRGHIRGFYKRQGDYVYFDNITIEMGDGQMQEFKRASMKKGVLIIESDYGRGIRRNNSGSYQFKKIKVKK